jgi:hypothetical protein
MSTSEQTEAKLIRRLRAIWESALGPFVQPPSSADEWLEMLAKQLNRVVRLEEELEKARAQAAAPRVIQIEESIAGLYALRNDGTLWHRAALDEAWTKITVPPIPSEEAEPIG